MGALPDGLAETLVAFHDQVREATINPGAIVQISVSLVIQTPQEIAAGLMAEKRARMDDPEDCDEEEFDG